MDACSLARERNGRNARGTGRAVLGWTILPLAMGLKQFRALFPNIVVFELDGRCNFEESFCGAREARRRWMEEKV